MYGPYPSQVGEKLAEEEVGAATIHIHPPSDQAKRTEDLAV